MKQNTGAVWFALGVVARIIYALAAVGFVAIVLQAVAKISERLEAGEGWSIFWMSFALCTCALAAVAAYSVTREGKGGKS